MLDFGDLTILLGASFFAGFINSIVGSGTLITFPTLIVLGINPIVANASNNLGLVPGAISAAIATRKDFQNFANSRFLKNLIVSAALGSIIGSLMLLVTSIAFLRILIPILIIIALVTFTLFQIRLRKHPVLHPKQKYGRDPKIVSHDPPAALPRNPRSAQTP